MYSQLMNNLANASIPVRQLHGRGAVAVTLAAGRIIALAFSHDGPNLLWTNPELADTRKVKAAPDKLVGGLGGDRLWFSPELRYHWAGKPDWRGLSNYHVPSVTDPGQYAYFDGAPDRVALAARGRLRVQGKIDDYLDFAVERKIRLADPPLPLIHPLMHGVDYVGVQTEHELTVEGNNGTGEIALWHILQTPVGSTLIVPLRHGHETEPLSYGLPGGWQKTPDSVIWRIEGKANAKFGIAAEALTGRAAILRELCCDRWCLIVRQFPLDTSARYGDHPDGVPRDDQVLQAWDGLGFGEMEYHSPVLNTAQGPRTLHDEDHLWAFGGTAQTIAALAKNLLDVDIRSLLPREK